MNKLISKILNYISYKLNFLYARNIYPLLYSLYVLFRKLLSQPNQSRDVIILDDTLPNILSAYRASEFSFLLQKIENCALYSIIENKKLLRYIPYYIITSKEEFTRYKNEFVSNFKLDPEKIKMFYPWTKVKSKIAYIVFLNNAFRVIDYLEKYQINFILELYPGGGFVLQTEGEQYEKLKRVLSSPSFIHVIVTQKVTNNFLIENKLCDPSKISFKYWGVTATTFLDLPPKTIKYNINKDTLDICFTASKYTLKGVDKGYDIFIDMAYLLLKQSNKFHFHIVGGFDEYDIEIDPAYRRHFHFHGFLKTNEFIQYYKDKDIFISPNRPNILANGGFDGFPTGTCADAGQNGLCIILSDPLNSNVVFENNIDVLFTENDSGQVAEIILKLFNDPEEIYRVGENGKKKLNSIEMNPYEQLNYRLTLINHFLDQA